jgi:hypothetical protein
LVGRFILKAPSGEEGFMDVSLSGTNSGDKGDFNDYFLTEDPRKTHRWPEKVWSTIEEKKVFIGMTAEQACMSWGKPKDINRTISGGNVREQWVYRGRSYLYFENEILTGIQN